MFMSKNRRKFDNEFKRKAVNLSYASSKLIKEVAEDIGINADLLSKWRKRFTAKIKRPLTMEQENHSLRLELIELKIEVDKMKKTVAQYNKFHE